MKGKVVLLAMLLLVGELAAQGLAGGLENPEVEGRPSALRDVAANWKALSILLVLVSVGLVALAFAISQSFSLPDLRAWAEVEMGEVFTTAFIIIFIVAIFVFVDAVAVGLAQGSMFAGLCDENPEQPCSLVISNSYVDSYIGSAAKLYETISVRRIEAAQSAYKAYGLMGTYSIYLYFGMNMRNAEVGNYMIDMETYDQLLQFLGTIISTLHTQKFLLNLLMSVGPLILLLGIILRAFFLTRKLGGLMMAFGIGFMLVYPATYALAYFTLNATVYGVDTKAGGSIGVCPAACSETSPAFVETTYDANPLTTTTSATEIERKAAFTNDVAEEFMASTVAMAASKTLPFDYSMDEAERRTFLMNASPYWVAAYQGEDGFFHLLRPCKNLFTQSYTTESGYTYRKCDWQCMEIPFPHQMKGCTDEEATCQVLYEEFPECFATRALDEADPVLVEVDDTELNGCPADCRAMYPSKITELNWYGYADAYYADLLEGCPPQCRWVSTAPTCTEEGIAGVIGGVGSTAAYMDPACPDVCREFAPDAETASAIWCAGSESGEPNPTAFYIIPEIVFTDPHHCEPCIYVLDKGLTYQPEQVFLNCQTMCGTAGGASYSYEDPATMTNQVDGFVGTTEMKSVSKLAIPAFLLPIFGLVVTLMFIQALSPMLGGDIDIPGMMRML
ncbi:MAG: hypothetical protein WC350_00790 [Candidatus Micrarchaeia archaeon]|jgi:hypothetical protein